MTATARWSLRVLWLVPVAVVGVLLLLQPAAPGQEPDQPPAGDTEEPPPAGDPEQGKDLFTGSDSFENGGPACQSCHSVSGLGGLGGGELGPDLTGAVQKFGEAGLAANLQTLSFPTMQPVFDGSPLTPEEQADVLAFLGDTGALRRSASSTVELALWAVGGGIVLLLVGQLLWRRRLKNVRESMVDRARALS